MNTSTSVSSSAKRRMRLRGLLRKEGLQILRDPSSIAIAFVLPLVLLLIFGYGISLDARGVPVALVIENPTPAAVSFAASFSQSPYFDPHQVLQRKNAEAALVNGEVSAVVVLRSDFSRRLYDPTGAPIQLLVNGTDANTARLISGYVDGTWAAWLEQQARDEGRPLDRPRSRRAAGLVQRSRSEPRLPRARLDRDHHDLDRRAADGPGRRS